MAMCTLHFFLSWIVEAPRCFNLEQIAAQLLSRNGWAETTHPARAASGLVHLCRGRWIAQVADTFGDGIGQFHVARAFLFILQS